MSVYREAIVKVFLLVFLFVITTVLKPKMYILTIFLCLTVPCFRQPGSEKSLGAPGRLFSTLTALQAAGHEILTENIGAAGETWTPGNSADVRMI